MRHETRAAQIIEKRVIIATFFVRAKGVLFFAESLATKVSCKMEKQRKCNALSPRLHSPVSDYRDGGKVEEKFLINLFI